MTNNGKTIPVALGDTIEVTLDENPSTGFGWNATTTPGLAIITDRFEPSDTSGRARCGGHPYLGAPGDAVGITELLSDI